MIFITGDIHGSPWGVLKFARKQKVTKNDIIIIPGDVGANYYGTDWDEEMKANLSHHRATVLCVHGNHEMRPWEVEGYHLIDWMGGKAWVQDAFPTLIFAKDGEIYNIEGLRIMTIGGAYSVDKIWRILKGSGWWKSNSLKMRLISSYPTPALLSMNPWRFFFPASTNLKWIKAPRNGSAKSRQHTLIKRGTAGIFILTSISTKCTLCTALGKP